MDNRTNKVADRQNEDALEYYTPSETSVQPETQGARKAPDMASEALDRLYGYYGAA